MNDLPNTVKGTEIEMYVDDTNLTKHITSLGDVKEELIPEFEKVILWLKANKLSLNTLKTEFMFFGSSKHLKDTTNLIALRVGDKLIRRTKKVKYIGVILYEQLTWRDHTDYISTKIKRNIGAIKRIRNSLPKDYLEMLYKTIVEPHFRYCNTVWGHCGDTLLNRLQALQNRATRIISSQKYANTDHKYLLKNLKWLNVRQLIMLDTAVLVYKSRNQQVPIRTSVMFQNFEVSHRFNTRLAASGGIYTTQVCSKLWPEKHNLSRNETMEYTAK